MDNQNINEELEKFKLLSSYSTKKTLTENIEVIKEQYSSPEEEIYYTLVRAVKGPGTRLQRLKDAFSKMKDGVQLRNVEKILQQRPIDGYTNFGALLRGELENDNQLDFQELQKISSGKGINLKANQKNSPSGGRIFDMNSIVVTYNAPKTQTPDKSSADTKNTVVTGSGVVNPKKQTVNFRNNDNFPLKIGDSGPKIKKLQFCLGLPAKYQTGNFGEITMKAIADDITSSVDKKQPPNGAHVVVINEIRKEGMKKDIYDSFIKDCKGVTQQKTKEVNTDVVKSGTTQPVAPVTLDRKRPDLSTGIPKNLPTQAPSIQTPTTELSLEQQFQMAKINLDKAKSELDAAQATNDRAKIGAARGKQQAARKEVQRLRNELYPPQQ